MTTTRKTTRTTTKPTTAKPTSAKRAPRAKVAPEPAPEPVVDDSGNVILSTLRSGFGALEFGTMAVADLPLTVLNKVGVPKSATDAARSGSRSMIHGVNGTLDGLATQTFKFAGQGASFVSGLTGSVKS